MHLGAGRLRHCAAFLRAANLAVLVTAWDGVIIWLVTSASRPIGQKAAPASWCKNVGKDAYQASGSYHVLGRQNPLRRDMSVCYYTVKETATKASLSQAGNPFLRGP
jgi:hypothetical protein